MLKKDEENVFDIFSIKEAKDNYNFPISRSDAFKIARLNETLKTDYYRKCRENLTYISFDELKITLVEKKKKKYWQVEVLSGERSGVEIKKNYTIDWDGIIPKKDLSKLRCLIDVETGEYIYYPKKNLIF